MKEFKVFSYIRKYRAMIVALSLIMGALFYNYFAGRQVYTAQALIQYTNRDAVNGLAPDGTAIDPTEIYSSEVMTKVFEKLGMSYDENNMDAIRAAVSVEPVQTEEESAVQTALNEKGEVALEQPTKYLVSFSVNQRDTANPEKFASEMLGAMLDAYTETYAENHVNSSIAPNTISGIYDQDYDYIEMLETLESSMNSALEQLQYKDNLDFRSADTGYSFQDLSREIDLLLDIDLSNAYAYILGNRVTKDQQTLLAKYENRIENSTLGNEASQSQVSGIDEIITRYVEMMRRSGNTDLTNEYILGNVFDNYYRDLDAEPGVESYRNTDTTTEYDNLMNDYVSERTDFESALIDIAYYEYILGIYTGSMDESSGVTVSVISDPGSSAAQGELTSGAMAFEVDTTVVQPIVSSDEQLSTAYSLIKDMTDRLDSIYEIMLVTNAEYNQYAGAANIAILTDTITLPALNLPVYAALAVVLFGIIGCILAIVIGRLTEIFEYYAFVDKKMNIANRTGCDRYMGRHANRVLPPNYTCVYMKMTDIETKNKVFGREQCDRMMADFCKILKDIFKGRDNFIALNGPGQFLIFAGNMEKAHARACVQQIGTICTGYNGDHDCKISYVCGISSSGTDEIFNIRKLMISAINKAANSPVRRIS